MTKTKNVVLATAAVAAFTLLLSGCGASSAPDAAEPAAADSKTEIRVGFNPGPYREIFEGGIAPILAEDGYTTESIEFTDGIVTNVALSTGEIDANIIQHPTYLEFVNNQEGIENAALVQIPTPPMSLWGGKKTTLDDVADGSTVSVPNSPSNLYRALLILQDVGWITVDDLDDPNTASLADVTSNPKNLNLVAIENAQQVPSLQDVDYAAIQGNFAIAAGFDLGEALALEDQPVEFSNVVAVDGKNLEAPWAQAIKAAYESPEFIDYITANPQYAGFVLPAWFD